MSLRRTEPREVYRVYGQDDLGRDLDELAMLPDPPNPDGNTPPGTSEPASAHPHRAGRRPWQVTLAGAAVALLAGALLLRALAGGPTPHTVPGSSAPPSTSPVTSASAAVVPSGVAHTDRLRRPAAPGPSRRDQIKVPRAAVGADSARAHEGAHSGSTAPPAAVSQPRGATGEFVFER
jgi:hypothetical protein